MSNRKISFIETADGNTIVCENVRRVRADEDKGIQARRFDRRLNLYVNPNAFQETN